MSDWKILVYGFSAVFVLGVVWWLGAEWGWDARVRYEVLQCADYGRCFH